MSVVGAVECRGFRNLAAARTSLAADVVVVHGPNGAGKTNLLEAVYFGLTGRSFRAGDDRDLIRYRRAAGSGGARARGRARELLAALDRSGERRHLLSGRALSGDPGERPLVSVFHPDRLALVKGCPCPSQGPSGPSLRRDLARACRPAAALRPHPRAAQRPGRPRPGRIGGRRIAGFLGRAPGGGGGAADRRPGGRGRRARRAVLGAGCCVSASAGPRSPIGHGPAGDADRARRRAGAAPRGGPGARLYLLRATAGRGRAAVRGPAAAALRLPGPATAGAARPALRRARGVARGAGDRRR